jgi:hypothetical protein
VAQGTVDKSPDNRELWFTMKKRSAKKKPLDYPDETEGSRMAAEIREKANKLTPEQREEYFRQAMQVYYGGAWPKQTTRR